MAEAENKVRKKGPSKKKKHNPRIATHIKGTIIETPRAKYKLGRKLGNGALGVVVDGICLSESGIVADQIRVIQKDNKKIAVKLQKKPKSSINLSIMYEYFDIEVEAMRKIDHTNVLRLFDYSSDVKYKDDKGNLLYNAFVIVLELAPGGELFDILLHFGKLSEDIARTYFYQLMSGIKAIHDVGFVHRDLKPQNLLLSKRFVLKIADFGHAKQTMFDNMLMNSDRVGTRGFHAPEQLIAPTNRSKLQYNKKVDIFAAGVVLFILVTAHPPFREAMARDRWFKNLAGKRYAEFWKSHHNKDRSPISLSQECKDIIQGLLQYQPTARILVEQALEHPWVKRHHIMTEKELNRAMIKNHRAMYKIKRDRAMSSPEDVKTPFYEDQETPIVDGGGDVDPRSGSEPKEKNQGATVSPADALRQSMESKYGLKKARRGRDEDADPSISHILRNYRNSIQAPVKGRQSMYNFTPAVLDDGLIKKLGIQYDRVPEVSDVTLNLFNSYVIYDTYHPYQLFLPMYRFFQERGGKIDFEKDNFILRIAEFPLNWQSDRPEPGDPGTVIANLGEPSAATSNPPLIKKKLKKASIDYPDDNFLADEDISIRPDSFAKASSSPQPSNQKNFDRLDTIQSDIFVSGDLEEFVPKDHTAFVNIYVTCVQRRGTGKTVITFASKSTQIPWGARRSLKVVLDELYGVIAEYIQGPFIEAEFESTGDIFYVEPEETSEEYSSDDEDFIASRIVS